MHRRGSVWTDVSRGLAPSGIAAVLVACGGATVQGADVDAAAGRDTSSDADGGEAASDASCFVGVSNPDLSCAVDTDCVWVAPGDYCQPQCCRDATLLVNASGAMQFKAALAETPIGSGAVFDPDDCSCLFIALPRLCCREGTCMADCVGPADTLAACADAGGTCAVAWPGTTNEGCGQCNGCSSGGLGPAQSCAYDDEVCCVPCHCP
jgi:hypothetical protein